MKFYLALIPILFTVVSGFAYQSTRIEKYELSQCYENKKCLKVTSDLAFLSLSLETIAAENATLQIFETAESKLPSTKYLCHSMTFNLNRLLLVCDNSEIPKNPSVMIDSNFKVTVIPAK